MLFLWKWYMHSQWWHQLLKLSLFIAHSKPAWGYSEYSQQPVNFITKTRFSDYYSHKCHYCTTSWCNKWLLPLNICQSSIGGRPSGSNAYIAIAVLVALDFLEGTLQIPMQLWDLNITIPMYTNIMIKGNQLYNSFNLPVQQPNFEVRQVLHLGKMLNIWRNLKSFHTWVHMHPSFAAVLIVPPDKSMVLCFDQTSICLFASHTHGLQGGTIAISSSGNVGHFVKYLERMVMQDSKNGLQGSNIAVLKLK